MNKLFLIDLDDTLIYTHIHYMRAQNEFAEFILDSFGNSRYSSDDIVKMQLKRQMELVKKAGFDTEVFPQSFKDVYVEIGKEFGMNSGEIVSGSNRMYEIGKTVFDEKRWKVAGMYSGAEDTLEFLTNMGDELALVTLGDSKMQNRKVEVMGLERWFSENIHVVLREKGSKISELSSGRNKNSVYFVGNSYNSDIRPALDAGIRGIYIPQDLWSHDGHLENAHSRVIMLDKIGDLKDVYDSRLG